MTITTLIIMLIIILVLDLLVSMLKSTMTHTKMTHLLNLREKDQQDVDYAIKIMERPRLRTTLRLALVLNHFLLAAILVLLFQKLLTQQQELLALLIVFLVALFVSLLEFFIEGLVLKDPERAAVKLAGLAHFLDIIFTPLSMLMTAVLGKHAESVTLATMTDAELRNWVEVGETEGSLDQGEREMIYSIFRFGDTLAREIMVPRIDVLALDINTTIGEARHIFIEAGHSRVPVYEDTIDNVIGLLYAKDLLATLDDETTISANRQVLRTAYFVPEAKKVDDLLAEMQSRGVHMTLVVDEFGGVAGVVTLEDIVEEIVGEIRDEYDEIEEQLYQKIDEDEYIFLGRVDIDDFNQTTGLQIAKDNADTLGGFLYGEMGHVPVAGEMILAEGAQFTIEEVVGRRILKVRVCLHQKDKESREVKDVN